VGVVKECNNFLINICNVTILVCHGLLNDNVAELVKALDLKSNGISRVGSNPAVVGQLFLTTDRFRFLVSVRRCVVMGCCAENGRVNYQPSWFISRAHMVIVVVGS
jgi:hypothetical protein